MDLVYFTSNFFGIRAADPPYIKLYEDEVEAFKERLTRRAKTKRDAALAEVESDECAQEFPDEVIL